MSANSEPAYESGRIVTVFCDAPNCGYWSEDGVAHTALWARRQLARHGWRLNVPDPEGGRRRKDYCPRHVV